MAVTHYYYKTYNLLIFSLAKWIQIYLGNVYKSCHPIRITKTYFIMHLNLV